MTIKIAINQNHKNKMPDLPAYKIKDWWREFNGQFENFNLPSIDGIIWAIRNGYAITAQHAGYRKRENFVCGQHIGLDFDTGDALSEPKRLAQHDFIKRNAGFIHTTASSTKHNPRARVLFILECPIYSKEKYTLLTEAFANFFSVNGGADPSCKDPVRLFFGAENCEVLSLGNTLTFQAAKEIVIPYKEKVKQTTKRHDIRIGTVIGDAGWRVEQELGKLALAPDGEKWHTLVRVSRTIGGYVGAGYLDEWSAIDMLSSVIAERADDMAIATSTIEWGIRVGKSEPLYLEEDLDPVISSIFA